MWGSYQVQNRDFHHALIKVRCTVFHDFHGHNLLSLEILALYDLPKCALPKDVKDEVAIFVPIVFVAKYVVHVEDVVTVFVIISIILDPLARFGQDPPWVPGGLVFELWVTDSVRRGQMCSQGLQGTDEATLWIGSPISWLSVYSRNEHLRIVDLRESWGRPTEDFLWPGWRYNGRSRRSSITPKWEGAL